MKCRPGESPAGTFFAGAAPPSQAETSHLPMLRIVAME